MYAGDFKPPGTVDELGEQVGAADRHHGADAASQRIATRRLKRRKVPQPPQQWEANGEIACRSQE